MAHPAIHEDITPMYQHIIGGLWPTFQRTWKHDWRGGEHIPTTGGFVAASNHISYVDPLTVAQFLVANGRAPRYLAKSSLFGFPVLKSVMRGTGQIPVVRGSSQAVHAYDAALESIRRGDCVCVLPEGTLSRETNLWPMSGKTGAARIALSTGCPLVPIATWGTQEILYPYRGMVPRLLPRKTVKVYAGPPVDLDDLHGNVSGEAVREATRRLMAAITTQLEVARGESAPTTKSEGAPQ
ncbi:lysophospholipid acyltransferase family protein [Calidifontibacter terrae]